jgi:hypothetical protein
MNILTTGDGTILSEQENLKIAKSLVKLNFEVALTSEKIFQLKQTIGKPTVFKTVCALLKMFSDATKVNKPLSASEIILCTDWMLRKYTHESIADFALALKEAIYGGHKLYGAVTVAVIKQIIENYFEYKTDTLEKVNHDFKFNEKEVTNELIRQLAQTYTAANFESFREYLDRKKREKAQNQINEWKEKMKTPDVFDQFNEIIQPCENHDS